MEACLDRPRQQVIVSIQKNQEVADARIDAGIARSRRAGCMRFICSSGSTRAIMKLMSWRCVTNIQRSGRMRSICSQTMRRE